MELSVYFRTYNSFGGHATLILIGEYLLLDAPAFGDALAELEIIMCFRSDGPPRKSLETIYDNFHAGLDRLPTVTYRRKTRKAEITFCSDLLTARGVTRSQQLSHALFCDACTEVVEHIKLLRTRIRSDDSFDFARFQAWLERRVGKLPQTIDELMTIQAEIESRKRITSNNLTPADRLGVDLADFHPDAPSLLDDPRFWNICDEWAPHGNDTGADVLGLYRDWWKRDRNADAETFFNQLMRHWQVTMPPDPADKYSTQTYHQAIVGLAFAQLKLQATCEPQIASLALKSLQEQPAHHLTERMVAILEQHT